MNPEALWHTDASRSEIRTARLEPEGILVKARASLISTGTERLVASGGVPEGLHQQMAVPHQEGNFRFPIKYGYSLVGIVEEPEHTWNGQLVHLLHPHQTICRVPEEALFPVPHKVPARRATLASNLETAVNAVWDSGVSIGDRVLIVGFGLIGALTAELIRGMPAVDLWIAEVNPERRSLAASLGFRLQESGLPPVDLAIHCSATEAGLNQAMAAVGLEGMVLEMSWYGETSPRAFLGGPFHAQRLTIRASQVSNLPPDRLPRWNFRRRKEVVFELLNEDRFDLFLSHEVPFEELPTFFGELRQGHPNGLAWTVSYDK